MLVSIHVVARLFRVPILRIDGDVVLVDDDRLGNASALDLPPRARRELTAGRLLALAEAELAAVDDHRRQRADRGSYSSVSRPSGSSRPRSAPAISRS